MLAEIPAEIVLLDLEMPNLSGKELLPIIVREFPWTPVIIVTADDQVKTAVDCIKAGAFDYVVKTASVDRLLTTIRQAISFRELNRQNRILAQRFLSKKLENPEFFAEIITGHHSMHEIFRYIEVVAPTTQPLLITGETGVGKELLARAIHRASGCSGRFVNDHPNGATNDQLMEPPSSGHFGAPDGFNFCLFWCFRQPRFLGIWATA